MPDGQSVTLYCERAGSLGPSQLIHFYWKQPEGGTAVSFAQLLDAMGELPIPPYLNRATEEKDKETYQTVYSRIKGSVAAPTAGLHYTQEVLEALRQKDIRLEYLTLHVGAGTFKPVKSETIEGHDMHTEFISVPRSVIEDIYAFGRKFVGEAMEEFAAVACCLSSQSEGAREGLLVVEEIVIVGIERLQSLDDGSAVVADACMVVVIAFGVETDFHIILSYQSPRRTRLGRTSD